MATGDTIVENVAHWCVLIVVHIVKKFMVEARGFVTNAAKILLRQIAKLVRPTQKFAVIRGLAADNEFGVSNIVVCPPGTSIVGYSPDGSQIRDVAAEALSRGEISEDQYRRISAKASDIDERRKEHSRTRRASMLGMQQTAKEHGLSAALAKKIGNEAITSSQDRKRVVSTPRRQSVEHNNADSADTPKAIQSQEEPKQ